MFTQVLWWMENILLSYLLIRGVQQGLWRRYPFFYSYIGYVLVESLLRYVAYMAYPHFYRILYWNTQLFSVALSFFLVLEIYNAILSQYPGAAKIARGGLLIVILFALSRLWIIKFFLIGVDVYDTPAMLERDLRLAQIISLAIILSTLVYYRVPIGKNTKGLVLGYGLYLGTAVGILAIHAFISADLGVWWGNSIQIASLIALLVWSFSLSSYCPNPPPPEESRLSEHYEVVATLTSEAISQATRYLGRAIRP